MPSLLQLDDPKMSKTKQFTILFLTYGVVFGALTALMESQKAEPDWMGVIFQAILFALLMALFIPTQYRHSELYFASGSKDKLMDHMRSRGYTVKKIKGETIYLKKKGFTLTPFRSIYIRETSYYSMLRANFEELNTVPTDIEKINKSEYYGNG